MGTTITNNYTAVCRNVAKDNGLDAAILVTVKSDCKKETAAIELHGAAPNEQAVLRIKEIISTALTESIEQFKAEKAKQEAQAEKSGDITEENTDKRNVKLLFGMLKRIDSEMEIFWRASVMARGGRVDSSRWNGLQKEMDNARRIMARIEWENAEAGK